MTGPVPKLPPSMRRLDLSDNNLVGEIEALDVKHLQVCAMSTHDS
jgi:hypothetical protein